MQQEPPQEVANQQTVLEAIAKRLLVRAEYNSAEITLAPHQLFERHGDLFVGALNTGKTWRSDEEPRLGYFKLKGLRGIALTADAFEPLEEAGLALPRETDNLLFAV